MSEDVTFRRPAEPPAGTPHTLQSAAGPEAAAADAAAQLGAPTQPRPDGAARLLDEPTGPVDAVASVEPAATPAPADEVGRADPAEQPAPTDRDAGQAEGPLEAAEWGEADRQNDRLTAVAEPSGVAPSAVDATPQVATPMPPVPATEVDHSGSDVSAAAYPAAPEADLPAPADVVSVEADSGPTAAAADATEPGPEAAGGAPTAVDPASAAGTTTEDDSDSGSAPDGDTDGVDSEQVTTAGTAPAVITSDQDALAETEAPSGTEATVPVDTEGAVDAQLPGSDEAAPSTQIPDGADGTAAEPAGDVADALASDPVDEAGDLDAGPDPDELRGAAEAVLLVVDTPLSVEDLARVLEVKPAQARELLAELRDAYDERRCGFALREVAGGWRLYTREEFSRYVERYVLDGQQARLTQAALETLSVIAYRQPVTRSRIAAIRGVGVDGVMRTLLTRGLVEECGTDPDSGGNLYRTTSLFLEKLGLRSLDELPSLAPLLPEIDAVDDVATSA